MTISGIRHGGQYKTYVLFCKVRRVPKLSDTEKEVRRRARPRGRAPVLRAVRLRRRDGRPPRAGDRPLARRDLQLVPLEAGAVPRPRGRGQHAPARALRRARLRRAARGADGGRAGLARRLPRVRPAPEVGRRPTRALARHRAARGARAQPRADRDRPGGGRAAGRPVGRRARPVPRRGDRRDRVAARARLRPAGDASSCCASSRTRSRSATERARLTPRPGSPSGQAPDSSSPYASA